MLLSNADVEIIEKLGHCRSRFVRYDGDGFARLRNSFGSCVFYDAEECSCRIQEHKPLGCRVYPVIYSEQEGIVMDSICPAKDTISEAELKRKGRIVSELLGRIDRERIERVREKKGGL